MDKFKKCDKVKYMGSRNTCPQIATVQRYYDSKMVEIRFIRGDTVVDEGDLILVERG